MRETVVMMAALSVLAAPVRAQTDRPDAERTTSIELYTRGIAAMLGEPDGGAFYLADRILGEGGRLAASDLPEDVAQSLRKAGYQARISSLAENGLWQFPKGALFMMMRELHWQPGRKLAEFSIEIGPSIDQLDEIAFRFKKTDEGWTLIEKGPPEGEG